MVVLPIISNVTAFSTDVVLSEKLYKLRYVWNVRDLGWFLTIRKQDDTVLLDGLRIIVSWELIGRFRNPDLPPGELFVLDTLNTGANIARDDLGSRIELIYLNEADIAELDA